jgi:hypothetical protein
VSPTNSEARIPVSMNIRVIASSRRFPRVWPFAGRNECEEFGVSQDRHRLLRNRWRRHALHRIGGDLAVVDEEPEQLLKRAVVLGDGGRADPFEDVYCSSAMRD